MVSAELTHAQTLGASPEHVTTFVYFILDESSKAIKIGWSRDPDKRLKAAQTASPHPLRIIGVHPGTRSDEQALHEAWAPHRLCGEWFTATPDLVAYAMQLGERAARVPRPREHTPLGFLTIAELSQRHIRAVLESVGGDKSKAARILGISRRSIYRWLSRMGA